MWLFVKFIPISCPKVTHSVTIKDSSYFQFYLTIELFWHVGDHKIDFIIIMIIIIIIIIIIKVIFLGKLEFSLYSNSNCSQITKYILENDHPHGHNPRNPHLHPTTLSIFTSPAYDGKKCEGHDADWETCANNVRFHINNLHTRTIK